MMREANARERIYVRTVAAILVGLATVGSTLAVTAGGLSWSGSRSPTAAESTPAAGGFSVTLSPSPVSIDKGQTVNLTAVPSGGTKPYTLYSWYEGLFSNCTGDGLVGSGLGPMVTVSNSTNVYVCVVVTDNSTPTHLTASSPATLVTVNPKLTVGSIGPAAALAPTGVIDNGTSVVLAGGAGNGTSPLKYSWFSGPHSGPCSLTQLTGQTSTETVQPTTNTSYCYVVTDSSSGTPVASFRSAAVNITVEPTLLAGPPKPIGLYGDSGQRFTLRSFPTGGTRQYTYQWYSGSSSTCSSDLTELGNGRNQSVAPTTSTWYCYHLSDSSYGAPTVLSLPTQVVVNSTLLAGPISYPVIGSESPAIDGGTHENVTLKANPSGGALALGKPYVYQWYEGNFSNCTGDTTKVTSGGTASTYTAQPASSLYFCYTVTDANLTTKESSSVLLTVSPVLSPGAPTPATPTIDVGRSVVLSANSYGGTPPYAYQWFAGTNCVSGSLLPNQNSATLTVNTSGVFVYRVTDSSNGLLALGQRSECATANATVALNSDPATVGPTVSPLSTIDLGQSVTLTASVTPHTGTPVITYQWYNGTSSTCSSDQNIAGATTTSTAATPTSLTSVHPDYFCFSVSDGSSNPPLKYSNTVLVTVNPDPTAKPITVTPGGNALIDSGTAETVTLYANPVGGTGNLSYQWYSGYFATCLSDTTPVGANSATFTTPVGLFQSTDYCYKVTDSSIPTESSETTNALTVIVEQALLAGAPKASSASVDVGQNVTLTASASAGTLHYTYQWFTAGNATCGGTWYLIAGATSTKPTYLIYPAVPGTTYYCYRVNDTSNGTPLEQSANSAAAAVVTVYGTLAAGPINCLDTNTGKPCALVIPDNDHVTLTAEPLQSPADSSAYQYAWYSGGSTVCSSDTTRIAGQTNATLLVIASSSGTYYCYTVTDGTHGVSPVSSPTYFVDPPSAGPASDPAAAWAAVPVAAVRTE